MATMRVEVLEEKLSDQDPEPGGRHYLLEEGDTVTVPKHVGEYWCSLGWAKDVEGNVETGERVVRAAVVQPDRGTLGASDSLEG